MFLKSQVDVRPIDVLPKLVGVCGNDDTMFLPELENALRRATSPIMTIVYTRSCYEEEKKEVMGSPGSDSV